MVGTGLAREILRARLDERLRSNQSFSRDLFGDTGAGDIYDFGIENYHYFLDNANTRGKLIEGLEELSPLADDALRIARGMSRRDFCDFRIALCHERGCAGGLGESKMPERYHPLLIPELFVEGVIFADRFEVTLGVAVARLLNPMQYELF